MESTSEVVWKEQSKSSVSKKCVQEVSATSVQKLSSSSSLVGEKSVLSILGSDGVSIGDKISSEGGMMIPPPNIESPLTLSSPIITSPSLPEEGNNLNTTSLQSEFSAMKLKDDHGNEIGEMVQQKEQQESVKVSSSLTSADSGSIKSSVAQVSSSSTSSSSVVQQSATSVLAKAQETSSSVSCSSYSSTKKQEIVSSSTRSLSSIKSSQSIEKVVKSSATAVVEDQEF